jgi:predicted transcriptional regulator
VCTLTASQILQADTSIQAVMVVDDYGGVQDLAIPKECVRADGSRLNDLLKIVAMQARSMMDLSDVGGKLRFVRISFENVGAFAFPFANRRILVLALDGKSLFSGRIPKLFDFLKSIEMDNPIEDSEIVSAILSELRRSSKPISRIDSKGAQASLCDSQDMDPQPQENETRIHYKKSRIVRSQNEIIMAILEACRTPSQQHWIMIRARLGYETFWTHMKRLMDLDMLKSFNDGKHTRYSITEGGVNLLNKLAISERASELA